MTSQNAYTAEEVAKWAQEHDIFHGADFVDKEMIKNYTLIKDGSKPTFTTVCCFAQETGQYGAVEMACHAFTGNRQNKPDFHQLLGGDESEFGEYCAKLVKT
ncbi:unnamed protein product, partial [Ectocarpus fasciculatus]